MSLKQQGNSEESSGDNSNLAHHFHPIQFLKVIQEFDSASNKAEFDPLVLSPTIGKAEGDRVGFSRNVKAGVKADEETAGKSAGELVMNYFRKTCCFHLLYTATHSFALMETLRHVETLASLQKFVTRQFLDNLWILQGSQFRSITSTWHEISDASRMDALWTARKPFKLAY
ncbi:hypothetical protein BASA83_013701 [Batrachochytrium salamandrivorans]|nr:hypothetical protein BASA83_013701 [Batrachochytrium salamandrivorans]